MPSVEAKNPTPCIIFSAILIFYEKNTVFSMNKCNYFSINFDEIGVKICAYLFPKCKCIKHEYRTKKKTFPELKKSPHISFMFRHFEFGQKTFFL